MSTSAEPPLVISSFPLTAGYRTRLESSLLGQPEYVTVTQLREAGLWGGVRRGWLGSRRAVVVASEAASSQRLEPAVCNLAMLLRGKPILIAGPSGRPCRASAIDLSAHALRLVAASADCVAARIASGSASLRPLRAPAQVDWPRGSWSGMRILYIKSVLSTGLRAGGSVGHVAGVANALMEAGADVRMVTAEPSPTLDPRIMERHPEGMGVFGLPAQANIFRMQRQVVRCAQRVMRDWTPHLVYQRLTLGDFSGEVIRSRFGVPLVTEYNGSEVWCNANWGSGVRYARQFLRAEERMLRASSLVFTISAVLRDELAGRGIPPERIGWYPNGIDPVAYDPGRFSDDDRMRVRAELGVVHDDYLVTFVGTFGDWHGADVLARAIAEHGGRGRALGSPSIRFIFVGDGKNRARAETIVREHGMSSRCRFLGLVPQADTPRILAASDCFVSPHVPNPDGTEFFGSPTKLFEYMAMARPIVASALGQIAAVLDDRQTALLVKPGDPSGIASSISELHHDRALGRRLGEAARREAVAKYTWSAHVEHLRCCLARCCGATRCRAVRSG